MHIYVIQMHKDICIQLYCFKQRDQHSLNTAVVIISKEGFFLVIKEKT